MTIVLAAGGTGGHIFPALALAEALTEDDSSAELLFIGIGTEIEQRLIGEAGFELEVIPFVPVTGKGIKGVFRLLVNFPGALFTALRLFRKRRPGVVIGFGGYPSFIPVIAAWLKRVPCILHEQNVQVGLANKILCRFANRIFAVHGAHGFSHKKPVTFLANPVRQAFDAVGDWEPPSPENPFTVLVVGGSQGAVSLNDAILKLTPTLKRLGIKLIHQSGAKDLSRVNKHYEKSSYTQVTAHAFIDDMAQMYAQAHLLICRAGAMTVAEVSASGRPAIFVPLPIAAGHQAQNAHHLVENGAALLIRQDEALADKLASHLEALVNNHQKLSNMAEKARECSKQEDLSAAKQIAREVLALAKDR